MKRSTNNPAAKTRRFGTLLRSHRKKLRVPMIALARDVGIDQGLLSRIERGQRPAPQIVPFVHRIAQALGFQQPSKEYMELLEAAYISRFGRKQPPPSTDPALYILERPPGCRGLRGLSGLPATEPAFPQRIDRQPLTGHPPESPISRSDELTSGLLKPGSIPSALEAMNLLDLIYSRS